MTFCADSEKLTLTSGRPWHVRYVIVNQQFKPTRFNVPIGTKTSEKGDVLKCFSKMFSKNPVTGVKLSKGESAFWCNEIQLSDSFLLKVAYRSLDLSGSTDCKHW